MFVKDLNFCIPCCIFFAFKKYYLGFVLYIFIYIYEVDRLYTSLTQYILRRQFQIIIGRYNKYIWQLIYVTMNYLQISVFKCGPRKRASSLINEVHSVHNDTHAQYAHFDLHRRFIFIL